MVMLDTSIIYKWIAEEETNVENPALKLLHKFLDGKEQVLISILTVYELANALATKTGLTQNQITDAWNLFKDLNLKIASASLEFMEKCIEFSGKYKVSVYDASYAVLAMERKCALFTADSKFVKKLNLSFVKLL